MGTRPFRSRHTTGFARGFTLIELLVVVAIIALLIAILLPSLARAKAHANRSVCLTNQRSMAQAMRMYAGDWENVVPRDAFGGWGAFFAPHLATYMGGPQPDWDKLSAPPWGSPGSATDVTYAYNYLKGIKIFKCPSLLAIDARYVLTYAVNSHDFMKWNAKRQEDELNKGLGFQKIDECRMPQATAFTVEANATGIAYDALGQYNVWRGWSNQPTLPASTDLPFDPGSGAVKTSNRMIAGDDLKRHLGTTTIGFFDGHAESVELKKDNLTPILIRGDL